MTNTQPAITEIDTTQFFQLFDGVSLFFGAMNQKSDTFYPLFGLSSQYGDSFDFEEQDVIAVAVDLTKDEDIVSVDSRSMGEAQHEFMQRLAANPTSVANTALFNQLMEVRL